MARPGLEGRVRTTSRDSRVVSNTCSLGRPEADQSIFQNAELECRGRGEVAIHL